MCLCPGSTLALSPGSDSWPKLGVVASQIGKLSILHVQFDEERVRDEKGEYEQCLAGLHFVRAPYATSSYSASSTGTLLGKVATYLAMIRICLFIT